MSKFDPPAPRYDPPTLSPPPTHQSQVHAYEQIETPPVHQTNEQTQEEIKTIPNAHAVTVRRCNKVRVVALSLRGASFLFSFLSFVIIATIPQFTADDSYNYFFAVAMISFIYNGCQSGKGVYELVSRKELISQKKTSALIDFIGDQVTTYMLMSGSSIALAAANLAKQISDQDVAYIEVYGKTAGGASMLFFAFLTLVFPTLFSGLNLTKTSTCSNVNVPKA